MTGERRPSDAPRAPLPRRPADAARETGSAEYDYEVQFLLDADGRRGRPAHERAGRPRRLARRRGHRRGRRRAHVERPRPRQRRRRRDRGRRGGRPAVPDLGHPVRRPDGRAPPPTAPAPADCGGRRGGAGRGLAALFRGEGADGGRPATRRPPRSSKRSAASGAGAGRGAAQRPQHRRRWRRPPRGRRAATASGCASCRPARRCRRWPRSRCATRRAGSTTT